MNKSEVVRMIGKENWKLFEQFMAGQTVGMKGNDIDYYSWDVLRFKANLERSRNR